MTRARDLADNAQNTKPKVVDAKGDLIVGTGADAADRLAVSDNGSTLVADSAATTGLRWQPDFSVGRNKIINGDFLINQRNFTSTTSSTTFGFDRWNFNAGGDGTVTYSTQNFTLGTAPVSGYEGKTFARLVTSGQTAADVVGIFTQRIESVRTLAGQTATISFWAKSASGAPKVAIDMRQRFGTGGSPSSNLSTYAGQVTLSTSWARYSVSVAIPSLSGITLGTNNDDALELNLWVSAGTDFNSRTGSLGIQTNTFDFWGVQVEAGSVATAFQTATGTLQGELAACQRYYYRTTVSATAAALTQGQNFSTTGFRGALFFPVEMRIRPTALETSGTANQYAINQYGIGPTTCNAVPTFSNGSERMSVITATVASGLTSEKGGNLVADATNGIGAYLGWSAEL